MQVVVYAKALILNEHGQVLLLRRSSTDRQRPGEQDYPGGGMEPDEDLRAGMSREIREETGLQIAPDKLQLLYAATEAYRERSVTRLVFWTRVALPNIALSFEHEDFHWSAPEQAVKEFPHPVYGAALAYALKHGIFNT
ncbi:MAG TPA: NUDIX hydrolase [Candidatus Saccharimonadales bacterium]|jgi:8-oxo-dGTP diphosphatase